MPKILLVEDNAMNRDMLSRRLIRSGFSVQCAVDGREGLEMALRDRPDLILMDLSLPDIDGWETTRQLKGIPETARVPVIALTANAMYGERERALQAGCCDFGTKPVDYAMLLQMIARHLGKDPATFFPFSPPSVDGRG